MTASGGGGTNNRNFHAPSSDKSMLMYFLRIPGVSLPILRSFVIRCVINFDALFPKTLSCYKLTSLATTAVTLTRCSL